jgi:uncharacterized protein YgiM (DUF1202 family)
VFIVENVFVGATIFLKWEAMRQSRRTFLKGAGVVAGGLLAASEGSTARTTQAEPAFTTGSDLTQTLGLSGSEIDDAIQRVRPGSPLVGLGDTWAVVAAEYDINELYMVAHAAHETAWGTSTFARRRNNLYGWMAYTENPGEARDFGSKPACIRYVMERVDQWYLTPGGAYYNGSTLSGMNERYATDPQWDVKIASIMNALAAELERTRSPAFEAGTNVITTGTVNARSAPTVGDNVRFTLRDEKTGRVVGGPEEADGFIWWQVEYDNGITGWSVQRYLDEYAGEEGQFEIGERVATTVDLSVRSGASTSEERKDVIPEDGAGYIRDGPINRDGDTWWKIGYNAGVEGWSVEAYLESAPIETTETFEQNQRVETTVDLSVRAGPSASDRRKTVVDEGSAGYIRDGPVDDGGYTWWKIGYNAGVEGWSAETYLEESPINPGKFSIGEAVEPTTGLSVRKRPTTDATREGVVPEGVPGVVRAGPTEGDGYTWWEVEYEDGLRGWSAENWLVEPSIVQEDFIWPVSGRVSSDYYDWRGDSYHRAVDIAAGRGADVVAAAPGEVITADLNAGGLTVFVEHANGYRTGYMHLSSRAVFDGQRVSAGDKVGEVGSTGRSTGPHLHLQMTRSGAVKYIPGSRGDQVQQGERVPNDYEGI